MRKGLVRTLLTCLPTLTVSYYSRYKSKHCYNFTIVIFNLIIDVTIKHCLFYVEATAVEDRT